jgi:hypothetical protein
MNGLVFGALIIAGGFALCAGTRRLRARAMTAGGLGGASAAEGLQRSAGAAD